MGCWCVERGVTWVARYLSGQLSQGLLAMCRHTPRICYLPMPMHLELDWGSLWVCRHSVDAKTAVAEALYYHNDFMRCHAETEAILAADEFAHSCLPYHLSSLVELNMPRQLFIDAHRLVDTFPESAEAWYAVACYYYLTQKMEKARFNFLKATTLSPYFAPAWLVSTPPPKRRIQKSDIAKTILCRACAAH